MEIVVVWLILKIKMCTPKTCLYQKWMNIKANDKSRIFGNTSEYFFLICLQIICSRKNYFHMVFKVKILNLCWPVPTSGICNIFVIRRSAGLNNNSGQARLLENTVLRDYWLHGMCPSSSIQKNTMFRELHLFPSSGERLGDTYSVGCIRKS
jgi:hypothetical protein